MTRRTNARVAGATFLLYIVVGITHQALLNQAIGSGSTAAQLASIARHPALVRGSIVLTLLEAMCAVVLAVTLYALTRDQDPDLAMLGMSFRLSEGVINFVSTARSMMLLSIATTSAATGADATATNTLGGVLLSVGLGNTSAFCFAVGSTFFCYVFLRARSIPAPLAWLGLVASILLVVTLPAQLFGFPKGLAAGLVWIPMALFEVTLALWLLIKGVASASTPRPGIPAVHAV